ncbi:M1 family metallopeptidase [Pareuzebyella sediminis]|uniref:M1 family metallopeptidase n=1 Tax=Pareuzebyella sediminis TaxID=2607998 RepID=UPI0011EBBFD7|nr:M1 family metallopeptidase [Pareuzebyella sediminis]
MRYFILFLSICFSSLAQHQEKIDFVRGDVYIQPVPKEKEIHGTVIYEFDVLKEADSLFLDAKNMDFSVVLLNGQEVDYSNNGKTLSIRNTFKKMKGATLKLVYTCRPKQTVYFLGWDDSISGNEQIWTQGQGKYTSYWLPSFDDMEEKIEFDVSLAVDSNYQVVANGRLVEERPKVNGMHQWVFDMQSPMSSYLLAFAIGTYAKETLVSTSGIPIENFYYPKDSLRVEPTYRYTSQIFNFMEKEIGLPYPWQNYKQIPVRDFLYAGMENTGTTIFSDGYVVDSVAFIDKNYVNVNAHELAHQWFGNLVTEASSEHHWLHEGFATYYAYLAEKEVFGDEHFYWTLLRTSIELKSAMEMRDGQSLLDPKASSLTFYEKGAWALFALRERIGEEAFKKGIRNYLATYSFKNVRVNDFLKEMEEASGTKLKNFKENWLESDRFPIKEAEMLLKQKERSIALLYEMKAKLEQVKNPLPLSLDYWRRSNSSALKQYIITNYNGTLPAELITLALASDEIPIRQSLAIKLDNIPLNFKADYESLLQDKSYITIENTLLKLWMSFPRDRNRYLDSTRDMIGLPNKNIRILWLTLAILTQDYHPERSQQYFLELTEYTGPQFSWEVRLEAFRYLGEIGLSKQGLKNLIQATTHHSWQFKKYARNLVDKLLEQPDYRKNIEDLVEELKGDELRYIKAKLLNK